MTLIRFTVLFLFIGSLASLPSAARADGPSREEAVAAMHRAVRFFRAECSTHGGYVYRVSDDLTKREGENRVDETMAWVEPPGTPAVGMAYLDAHRLTADPVLLEAAIETAGALVRGQLFSGGWMGFIEFDPQKRKQYAYRVDGKEVDDRKNWTTYDDDKSQSAMRFLMQLDKTLEFENETIHEAALYALDAAVKAQYPNGAWPQQFREFHKAKEFPVLSASFPVEWPREFPDFRYTSHYTLNDDTISDLITTMLDAKDVYGDERYLDAARRGGDFLILAQLPEPQPGWAQQYDREMHPVWARKFEPPAVTGGESQGAMRTLMQLFRRTGEAKYLEPIPQAIAYYRKSLLPDGRLARFYEIGTNRPLYFTKDYQLTYDDSDMPTHYGFTTSSRLDQIEQEYERLRNTSVSDLHASDEPSPSRMTSKLQQRAAKIIASLDERGAWVQEGRMRNFGEDDHTRRVIESATFAENLRTLATYVASMEAE